VQKTVRLGPGIPPVCRLGLATRGNTHLRPEDVDYAIERGINYLNWCGHPDGMSKAVGNLGNRRKDVVAACQFKARTAGEARREFEWILSEIGSDYLDIATLYYVESEAEWQEIIGPGGAWEALAEFKHSGTLKMIGLTSHQRKLAAAWIGSRADGGDTYHLDTLMIRYNAAHRGAEREVFPAARERGVPVVTFTGLRWRELLKPTPNDPPGFSPPSATECYRFCLSNPNVAVALTAPGNREHLEANLSLLDDWRTPPGEELEAIRQHGDRVHRHASEFW
jgi:predicted aldo/keto reductase-like oxidoreductase